MYSLNTAMKMLQRIYVLEKDFNAKQICKLKTKLSLIKSLHCFLHSSVCSRHKTRSNVMWRALRYFDHGFLYLFRQETCQEMFDFRKCRRSGALQYRHYLSSDAPDYPFSEIFSKAWSHVCYVCIFYVPRYLVIISCLTQWLPNASKRPPIYSEIIRK